MSQNTETIELKVLRVASSDVLGHTKPLVVAAPGRFSNAAGDLKAVDCLQQIEKDAAESAASFKVNIWAKA